MARSLRLCLLPAALIIARLITVIYFLRIKAQAQLRLDLGVNTSVCLFSGISTDLCFLTWKYFRFRMMVKYSFLSANSQTKLAAFILFSL